MLILRNVFIFALITAVHINAQNCSCGVTNPAAIPSELRPALIQNPTNGASNPCVPDNSSCTYIITLSDALANNTEFGGLRPTIILFSKGTSDAQLIFYDGQDPNVEPMWNQTTDISPDNQMQLPVTMNPSARLVLIETNGTVPATFLVSFTPALKGTGPPTTTLPPPATTVPTDPGGFACNPLRVQFELSVIIDCSSHIAAADFDQMRTFASDTLPRYLTIITQNDSKYYTRVMLTLAAPRDLTNPNSNYGTPFNPWEYNKEDFMNLVRFTAQPYAGSSNNSAFVYAMNQTFSHGFANPLFYPTRLNAARLMIILASADVDADDAGPSIGPSPLKDMFIQLHQNNIPTLVLSFGRSSNIINYGPWLSKTYTRFSDINNINATVFRDDIMNGLFCNGINLCQQANCGSSYSLPSANDPILISTRNYKNENSIIEPNRYCNNMNCNTTITNTIPNSHCIQIDILDYEIEPRNDYISVFDEDGEERARFTGTGVSSSVIFVKTKAIVSFFSDYQQVYGGFNATVSLVPTGPGVCLYPEAKKKHVEIDGVVVDVGNDW